jgi:predicted transcriptional regulator of viral defense system
MVTPEVVAKTDMEHYLRDLGIEQDAQSVISSLAEHGWLLPLRTKGYYEFAPARRAGRISSGDPFVELRATLHRRHLPVTAAFDSAAWLLGYSSREPAKHVLATPKTQRKLPLALRNFRVVHTWGRLESEHKNQVPVWRTATLLSQMAIVPSAYHAWADVTEWLEEALRRTDLADLDRELEDAPATARVRLAYLCDLAGFDYYARELFDTAHAHGTTYLGRSSRGGKYSKKYDLVDALTVKSQKR